MSASDLSTPQSQQFVRGRIVTNGSIIDDGILAFAGDRIEYTGPADGFDPAGWTEHEVPAGSLLLPGLIDTHCHGAFGGDFPSGDEAAARKAVDYLHRSGTTTVLASTVAASQAELLRIMGVLAQLAHEGLVAGIHAEGPFLATARCGAQNPQYLLDPDPEFVTELVEAAEGQLLSMTYAPELPGADELVDLLTSHGITPSLGHTDCDAVTATLSLARAQEGMSPAGFDGYSGRPTVTHLFNGMAPLHHRSPGPVAACLRAAKAGSAAVELIADGVHLDPQTVLTVFELVGPENVVLVSDSMAAAGCPDGEYTLGPSKVIVAGGIAALASDGSLAGGTATMLEVLRNTVRAGVPLVDAVTAATTVPAAILGLADEVGSLHVGYSADVVVATNDLKLVSVLREGSWLEPVAS